MEKTGMNEWITEICHQVQRTRNLANKPSIEWFATKAIRETIVEKLMEKESNGLSQDQIILEAARIAHSIVNEAYASQAIGMAKEWMGRIKSEETKGQNIVLREAWVRDLRRQLDRIRYLANDLSIMWFTTAFSRDMVIKELESVDSFPNLDSPVDTSVDISGATLMRITHSLVRIRDLIQLLERHINQYHEFDTYEDFADELISLIDKFDPYLDQIWKLEPEDEDEVQIQEAAIRLAKKRHDPTNNQSLQPILLANGTEALEELTPLVVKWLRGHDLYGSISPTAPFTTIPTYVNLEQEQETFFHLLHDARLKDGRVLLFCHPDVAQGKNSNILIKAALTWGVQKGAICIDPTRDDSIYPVARNLLAPQIRIYVPEKHLREMEQRYVRQHGPVRPMSVDAYVGPFAHKLRTLLTGATISMTRSEGLPNTENFDLAMFPCPFRFDGSSRIHEIEEDLMSYQNSIKVCLNEKSEEGGIPIWSLGCPYWEKVELLEDGIPHALADIIGRLLYEEDLK